MTPPTDPADQAAPGTDSTRLDASDAVPEIDLHADPGHVTPLCDPDGRERTAGR